MLTILLYSETFVKRMRMLLYDDIIKNCSLFCVCGDEFGKEYLDDIVDILGQGN